LRGLFLCAGEKKFGIDRTFLFCVFPEKMELEFGKNGFQVKGLRFPNCEKPGINQISGGGTTFWCAGGCADQSRQSETRQSEKWLLRRFVVVLEFLEKLSCNYADIS
jgi:hypothetical protein